MKRILPLSVFCLFFAASGLRAQAPASNAAPLKQCDARLARQLVEQQADFSRTLGETDRRISVLVKVADFLWTGDEDSARKYFAEAFQIAQERNREKDGEKVESKSAIAEKIDYRFTVVSAVARRDAEWAKKLSEIILKEFDEDKEKDKRSSFDKNREVRETLGVAAQTAKDNPDLALTLARRAMRYPLTNVWYFWLYRIAENNRALADRIYAEAVANYKDAEFFRLLYLSAYPFANERIFGIEKYSLGASVPADFSPDPFLQRQLLVALIRRALKLTPENTEKSMQTATPENAVAVIALNEIEPLIAERFPDLTQAFSQAKLHAASVVSNEIMNAAEKRNESGKNFNKSFAEKLKEAEEADAIGKLTDFQVYQLATTAKKEEDFKAAESWLDKMRAEQTRRATINYFYFQRSKLATEEKRFDEAAKFAERTAKIETRAVLYFDIAEAKAAEPNAPRHETLDTLLQVYQMAQKAPDSIEKAQVLMGLANAYEKVEHSNALDALALSIKTANALENPDLFTSSQTQQIKGDTFLFFANYEVPGFDLNKTFYEISRKDFQGALAQAQSFTDKYLRTLAIIAAVKDCEKSIKPAKPKVKR